MANTSLHTLSKNAYVRLIKIKLAGKFCRSMVLIVTDQLHLYLFFYCKLEVCVRVNSKQSETYHVWVLVSGNDVFCLLSSS